MSYITWSLQKDSEDKQEDKTSNKEPAEEKPNKETVNEKSNKEPAEEKPDKEVVKEKSNKEPVEEKANKHSVEEESTNKVGNETKDSKKLGLIPVKQEPVSAETMESEEKPLKRKPRMSVQEDQKKTKETKKLRSSSRTK